MNATNNINIENTSTVNPAPEAPKAAPSTKTNWLLVAAGVLFWIVVFFQFMLMWHDTVFQEFTDFVIHNALPLIAVLAYLGIRKEQKQNTISNSECVLPSESNS